MLLWAVLGAHVAVVSGCAPLEVQKAVPWLPQKEDKGTPARLVALWTDAVLTRPDHQPVRGFGGRLMFYAPKGDKPIKVRGTLVVYAFDESSDDPEHVKPDRKYVFTEEQFARHYSKSDLGHSYSVWLPWDEVGGPQKEISLLVRFLPTDGPVVVSDQTRHILPGRPPAGAELARRKRASKTAGADSDAEGVRQASYRAETHGTQDLPSATGQTRQRIRVTTTTIDIPRQPGRFQPVTDLPSPGQTMQPAARDSERPVGAHGQPTPLQPEQSAAVPERVTAAAATMATGPQAPIRAPQPGTQWPATGQARQTPPADGRQNSVQPGRPWPTPRATHFSLPRSRALGEPIAQLRRDHGLSQPRPAGWRLHPEQTLPDATGNAVEPSSASEQPGPYPNDGQSVAGAQIRGGG